MTTPITSTPVKANGYVQLEVGTDIYKNADGAYAGGSLGAKLGGQLSKGGTYAKAEVGYGTAFKAKAEVGHEFNIGKNMGLELSANAAYTKSTGESSFTAYSTFETATVSKDEVNNATLVTINSETMSSMSKWKDGYKKAGGALMMAFRGKKGNVKAGVEMGAYTNNAPDLSITHSATVKDLDGNSKTKISQHEYKGHNSGMYATPRVSAELNLGKKGNWSLVADADKFGGNAGVRFKF